MRGNRTQHRGRGAPPARLVITAAEGKSLTAILEARHGYSAVEAIPALLSGELKTVLLADEDLALLVNFLEAAAYEQPAIADILVSAARQLRG